MAKYKVIFKGVADKSPEGAQTFLDKFANAYKMTPEKARDWLKKTRGVIYTFDDEASAEKGRAYIEKLGGIAVVQHDAPPLPRAEPPEPPAPPEPPSAPAPPEPPSAPAPPEAPTAAQAPDVPDVPDFDDEPAAGGADTGVPDVPDFDEAPGGADAGVPSLHDEPGAGPAAAATGAGMLAGSMGDSGDNMMDQMMDNADMSSYGQTGVSGQAADGGGPAAAPEQPAKGVRPCPKCGRPVPVKSDECPYCQIFISKYEQMMERKAQAQQQGGQPGASDPGGFGAPAAGGAVYEGAAYGGAATEGPDPEVGYAGAVGGGGGMPAAYRMDQPISASRDSVASAAAAGVSTHATEATYAVIYGVIGLCCGLMGLPAIYYGFKAINLCNNDPRFTGKEMGMIGAILGLFDVSAWIAGVVYTLFFMQQSVLPG